MQLSHSLSSQSLSSQSFAIAKFCHRTVLSSQSFVITKFCHRTVLTSHSFVIAQFCHRTVLPSQSFVITKFCHHKVLSSWRRKDHTRNSATKLRNALSSYLCANLCRVTCVIIFVELLVWSFLRQDDKTLWWQTLQWQTLQWQTTRKTFCKIKMK